MAPAHLFQSALALSDLLRFYLEVRHTGEALGEPLSDADATVQSMPDASSAKWHLAHTTRFSTRFFEAMVLSRYLKGYKPFDEKFTFLFNSYYETLGAPRPRPRRGMVMRPALDEIYAYRAHVDQAHSGLLNSRPTRNVADLIELGRHHEQQHQQLLLTDILHVFAQNPIRPAYRDPALVSVETAVLSALFFTDFEGGIVEIGHDGAGFAFDSAGPRNRVSTEPFRLADRLVTNAEWVEFIEDGGYTKHLLWLSGGWAKVLAEGWSKPLYWQTREGQQRTVTLRGFHLVDPTAPVAHVTSRLMRSRRGPESSCRSEAEWEVAAPRLDVEDNFLDLNRLVPHGSGGATDVRRRLGMDAQPVLALPALPRSRGRGRRVQWQVHVPEVRFARRLLHGAGTPPRQLPQFLSGAHG